MSVLAFVVEDVVIAEIFDVDEDKVLVEDVEVDVDQDQVQGIAKAVALRRSNVSSVVLQ